MQVGLLLRQTANQAAVVTFPALNVLAFALEQSSELSECFVSCHYAVVYISNNLLLLSFLYRAAKVAAEGCGENRVEGIGVFLFVCLFQKILL